MPHTVQALAQEILLGRHQTMWLTICLLLVLSNEIGGSGVIEVGAKCNCARHHFRHMTCVRVAFNQTLIGSS